jgi:hypothetical protein
MRFSIMSRSRDISKVTAVISVALFLIGAALVLLNVWGRLLSLRHPGIYTEAGVLFKEDISLSFEQAIKEAVRRQGETDDAYARRLTRVVSMGVAHYWSEKGRDRYHLRVPAGENWLLYLKSFTEPEHYGKYEFADPEKALERGVGLCSQQAVILCRLLLDNGIDAKIIVLGGHVVVGARTGPGKWIVADPDYGVVVPRDIVEIMKEPELVRPYYSDVESKYMNPRRKDLLSTDKIVEIYGPEGNVILGEFINFMGPDRYYFELYSYAAIWIIPLLLFLPAAAMALKIYF